MTLYYKSSISLKCLPCKVLLLGSCQALLESCMYIFVFLWTPVLDTGSTPLGMVFSCFMVCIMVGSALFSILNQRGELTSPFEPHPYTL